VGGGAGIAPLLALGAALSQGSFDFYAGFRDPPGEGARAELRGPARHRSHEPVLAVESVGAAFNGAAIERGSAPERDKADRRGRITGFLDPAKYAGVYACGPAAMLKAVAAACKAAGTPCFVSLERPMACGVGACLGCTVRTRGGNRRCCIDGPIFNAEELIFDD
jgi:NAD(P)H-flavin reductase